MSRTHATFKQCDLVRAVKAVRAAGLEIVSTELTRDGSIKIVHKADASVPVAASRYDAWRATTNGSR
jgi:hypothetical protein